MTIIIETNTGREQFRNATLNIDNNPITRFGLRVSSVSGDWGKRFDLPEVKSVSVVER
jgi:hypothetical protein